MLVVSDEMGRTQQGNNNAYCQDSEISWIDWDLEDWQRELLEFTAQCRRSAESIECSVSAFSKVRPSVRADRRSCVVLTGRPTHLRRRVVVA